MKKRLSLVASLVIVTTCSISFVCISPVAKSIAENPPIIIDPPFKVIKKKPTSRTPIPKSYVVETVYNV